MSKERFERARELLNQVLELSSEQRQEFLSEACAGDAELHAEVDSLLNALAEGSGFLERPAGEATAIEESFWAGKRIGQYEIERALASGGMGIVFLARQEKPRRTVALKLLQPGILNESTLRRFELEAEILGRLQHPGIGQIFEAGTAETEIGSQRFLAMEFIDGPNLIEYCNVKNLKPQERLALFVKVCQAVHHAHQRGIIHRDLKPANILVDSSGQTKVLDFGIARAVDSDDALATLRTDVGQILGTLPYMSPEQVGGQQIDIDIRTDVYSLGVILYEMLAGRLPYDLRDKPIPEAISMIQHEDPVTLGTYHRMLRGDVSTIVRKSLDKEKRRRYASASELAADIERYLADEPIVARRTSAMVQLAKFARRNRALVVGVVVVFFSLILGTVGTMIGLVRAERALTKEAGLRSVAVEAQREEARLREEAEAARSAEGIQRRAADKATEVATLEAATALAVSNFLGEMLAAANPFSLNPVRTVARETKVVDVLDHAGQKLDAGELAEYPEVEATIRRILGKTYNDLGLQEKAEPHLRRAIALCRAVPEGELSEKWIHETLFAMRGLGTLLRQRRRIEESEDVLREAVAMSEQVHGRRGYLTSQLLTDLAAVLLIRDGYDEADSLLREALKNVTELHPQARPTLLNIQDELAKVALRRGNIEESVPLFRAVLQLAIEINGESHPDTAIAIGNLAFVLADLKRFKEAEELYRRSLETKMQTLGMEHHGTAASKWNLGMLLMDDGRPEEAEAYLQQAMETYGELKHRQAGNVKQAMIKCLRRQAADAEERGNDSKVEELLQRIGELRAR